MKQNPEDKKIQKNLQPGEFSLKGFLGNDKRNFSEIIKQDRAILGQLSIDEKAIAERMQMFTERAFESFDDSIIIDDIYEVKYDTYRGKLLCPFVHKGVYRKGLITLKNLKKDITIKWTPLNIHMIGEHCFFEGKDSTHRLEPADLVEALF
ncbi:MAG: hypothetical protein R6U84_06830 [Candidatus Cloacimonadales bacterium]